MPTYERLTRKMELTRIVAPLMLDGGVYWILVEDADTPSALVRQFAIDSNLPFAHVVGKTKTKKGGHRGIDQRNVGLDVVRKVGLPGVVYFADDDNVYDYRLFEELRSIKKVGLFATGYSGRANFERCVVGPDGKISGFYSAWPGGRKFQVDMAGFALNADLIKDFTIPHTIEPGHIEDFIIRSFIDNLSDAEPIGGCTTVYAWHMPKTKVGGIERAPKGSPVGEPLWAS